MRKFLFSAGLAILACIAGFVAYCFHVAPPITAPGPLAFEWKKSLIGGQETMCLLGDAGSGEEVQYAVVRAMHDVGCDDIRILGDLVYPSGLTGIADQQLKSNFLGPDDPLIEGGARLSLILGNHDYKQNASAWLEIARQQHFFFPFYYYAEKTADQICIFSLDTTWYDKLYMWPRRFSETRWLHDTEKKWQPDCKFSLALGHHFLRSSGQHAKPTPTAKPFLAHEIVGHFDLYIAGHEHLLSDEGEDKGTHLLISGAGSENNGIHHRQPRNRYASSNYGFVRLDFRYDEKGAIAADYAFYEVAEGKDGKPVDLGVRYRGTITGQGLR